MKSDLENAIQILLQATAIETKISRQFVMAPEFGGVVIFEGYVRNLTAGKRVLQLEFEAYESMAMREMYKIAVEAFERFKIGKISIQHRTGKLEIAEVPVIIAVSAAHRDAAFDACRYAIDELKIRVPIWKKEFFLDGEVWVAAHP